MPDDHAVRLGVSAFDAQRQAMLAAWQVAVQSLTPAEQLAEIAATLAAMRQLVALGCG